MNFNEKDIKSKIFDKFVKNEKLYNLDFEKSVIFEWNLKYKENSLKIFNLKKNQKNLIFEKKEKKSKKIFLDNKIKNINTKITDLINIKKKSKIENFQKIKILTNPEIIFCEENSRILKIENFQKNSKIENFQKIKILTNPEIIFCEENSRNLKIPKKSKKTENSEKSIKLFINKIPISGKSIIISSQEESKNLENLENFSEKKNKF